MVDSIGGFNFREQLPKLKGSNVPKDAQGLFDKFKKIKANDNNPLDSMGRLKEGWQYNPKTGEYRRKPERSVGPVIGSLGKDGKFKPLENPWIDGGSSVRDHDAGNGKKTLEYRPDVDDYEPTFEMKDGKLVKTGKTTPRDKIKYY